MKKNKVIIDRRPDRNNQIIPIVFIYIYYKGQKKPICYELERDLHLVQVSFNFEELIYHYINGNPNRTELGNLLFILMTSPKIIDFDKVDAVIVRIRDVYRKNHKIVPNGKDYSGCICSRKNKNEK